MQTLLNETKQENEVGELIKRMKVQNHDMHKLIKQCRLVLTKLNDKKKEQIQSYSVDQYFLIEIFHQFQLLLKQQVYLQLLMDKKIEKYREFEHEFEIEMKDLQSYTELQIRNQEKIVSLLNDKKAFMGQSKQELDKVTQLQTKSKELDLQYFNVRQRFLDDIKEYQELRKEMEAGGYFNELEAEGADLNQYQLVQNQ